MKRRKSQTSLLLIAAGLIVVGGGLAIAALFPKPAIHYHLETCNDGRAGI